MVEQNSKKKADNGTTERGESERPKRARRVRKGAYAPRTPKANAEAVSEWGSTPKSAEAWAEKPRVVKKVRRAPLPDLGVFSLLTSPKLAEKFEDRKARIAAAHKKWQDANKDRTRELSRRWRELNREKIRESSKAYRRRAREKIAEYERKRRASPDYKEKMTEKNKKYMAKVFADPEKYEKYKEKCRAAHARRIQDPERLERIREHRRKASKKYQEKLKELGVKRLGMLDADS